MKTQLHNKRIIPLFVFGIFILFTPLQSTFAENSKDIENEINRTEYSVNENDPYESHFFRIRGIPTIHVKSINGNIDLISNPNIDGIQVDLYVERAFTLWSGPRSLDDYRIIIRQQGDRIIASVEERRSGSSRRSGDIRFHFVVQTPGKVIMMKLMKIRKNQTIMSLNGRFAEYLQQVLIWEEHWKQVCILAMPCTVSIQISPPGTLTG